MELKVFESPGEEWDVFASRYTDLIFYQSIWSEVLRRERGFRLNELQTEGLLITNAICYPRATINIPQSGNHVLRQNH